MGSVDVTPRPLYHRERDPLPIVLEAGWVPGAGLGGCGKSRPKPGFYPQTVQPAASHYTDCAIPAQTNWMHYFNYACVNRPSFVTTLHVPGRDVTRNDVHLKMLAQTENVLVFTKCICVCIVFFVLFVLCFLYCFVYAYLFLFVLSVLV